MAKIDLGRIEGYASMTPEQKLAALEAFEYEDNAGELERLKNTVSKANSEAAEWKRKHNALLDDDEKKRQADAEKLEQALQELESLRTEKKVSEYKAQYLSMGYDEKLATDTAKALVDGNMDKVFANAAKHQTDLEKKVKAEVLKDTPKPNTENGGKPKTLQEISDIRDPVERQAAIAANLELYGYKER